VTEQQLGRIQDMLVNGWIDSVFERRMLLHGPVPDTFRPCELAAATEVAGSNGAGAQLRTESEDEVGDADKPEALCEHCSWSHAKGACLPEHADGSACWEICCNMKDEQKSHSSGHAQAKQAAAKEEDVSKTQLSGQKSHSSGHAQAQVAANEEDVPRTLFDAQIGEQKSHSSGHAQPKQAAAKEEDVSKAQLSGQSGEHRSHSSGLAPALAAAKEEDDPRTLLHGQNGEQRSHSRRHAQAKQAAAKEEDDSKTQVNGDRKRVE
jgi:hypothetical protein